MPGSDPSVATMQRIACTHKECSCITNAERHLCSGAMVTSAKGSVPAKQGMICYIADVLVICLPNGSCCAPADT